MRRLVALDMPAGDAFVAALRRAFDQGDAVLPLDHRLPLGAKARLVEALAPSMVASAEGELRRADGRPVEDGDALVVATSGTSGEPKGVVLTHDALAASARATSEHLAVDPGRDRWLCCIPVAHVGGLSVILRALLTDTPCEVQPRFEVSSVMAACTERGATLVSLVATALGRLGTGSAAFRRIVLGGARPPSDLPDNVVTTYGLTETGSGVVYDGRPLAGVEVRIAPDGEIGLRAPMLLRAYRDGRDPKDADGFFWTGDLGEIAADGRLAVHGRRDELILSGGENLWPAPIEAVIAALEEVRDVAVVGVPDPEWGESAVACVVLAPGTGLTLERLRAVVRDELGPVHAPRHVLALGAIPRSALGKVRRGALRTLAAKEWRGSPSPS